MQTPRDYKHSDSIVKELSKHQSLAKHCDLAYSLPQGGIAIHLKSDCDSLDFIKKWPNNAFGGNTSAHRCRQFAKTNSWIVYVKDIPTALSITCLKDSIHQAGKAFSSIRRVRFHDSKKPMLVLTFDKESDYLKAINTEGIRIPGVKRTTVPKGKIVLSCSLFPLSQVWPYC